MVIPRKNVYDLGRDKLWNSKSLKQLLNQEKLTFYQGRALKTEVQKCVKQEIRQAKLKYQVKVEIELRNGNSCSLERPQICVWNAE